LEQEKQQGLGQKQGEEGGNERGQEQRGQYKMAATAKVVGEAPEMIFNN
jgi:hypothetical protein